MEGVPIRWYYSLEPYVQANWKELCAGFVKQYGLNSQMEVSLKDLQNTKQKFNKSFSEYLTRWRGKLAQMRQRPTKSDQLMLAIDGCIPPLARKLNDIGIRNFEELYRFGVQKETDVAQEKRFYGGRSRNKEGPNSNVQINAIK